MSITRRDFVKVGASAAALASVPRPLRAQFGGVAQEVPPIQDPRVKELASRALDAARSAGASYADVRLSYTWERTFIGHRGNRPMEGVETLAGGVRALVNGYWGFASGPVWSADEMARLGREAAHQAQTNALGKPREVALAPTSKVLDGHWVMPVKSDPFDVFPGEVLDLLEGLRIHTARDAEATLIRRDAIFQRQETAFGSTDGSYCTQRTYRTSSNLGVGVKHAGKQETRFLNIVTPAGLGWEHLREAPLRDAITRLVAEMKEDLAMPVKPVDVGRYDIVFDAKSVADVVDETLGVATQLDRALGYEANAGGTSWLNDPVAMRGTQQVGAPILKITGNRSEAGGCATVKWDGEGVPPEDFALVNNGVLADFQTTRETAAWMKTQSGALRSHGCAGAPSALEPALTHTPNLILAPGREAGEFNDLVADLRTGIAVKDVELDMDFQQLNGYAIGRFYDVKQGKRVARLAGAGILFRSPELWKGLLRLGGSESARRYGAISSKGEPSQLTYHSVTAVPAVFKQLTVVDVTRKA
jgi:TldD protein